MRILLIGNRGEGKTSYYKYIRALFIKGEAKYSDGTRDRWYMYRTSPALERFWLPKTAGLLQKIQGATAAIKEYRFDLCYNPRGWNRQIGGNRSIFNFSFIDVPGGVYLDFLKTGSPAENWDEEIKIKYPGEYDAFVIIFNGKNFLDKIQSAAYKVTNLISCAVTIARGKGIPAWIVITHADELHQDESETIKTLMDSANKSFYDMGFVRIPYVLVDVNPEDDNGINSHLLDNPLRKAGQLPFFMMLRDYMYALEDKSSHGNAFRNIFVPSESERLQNAITDIERIISEIQGES